MDVGVWRRHCLPDAVHRRGDRLTSKGIALLPPGLERPGYLHSPLRGNGNGIALRWRDGSRGFQPTAGVARVIPTGIVRRIQLRVGQEGRGILPGRWFSGGVLAAPSRS